MALRYGSKIASSLRYNHFNSSVLRYGSKIGWTSGGEVEDNTDIATPAEYFTFTSLSDGTYSLKAKDVTNIPENVILPSVYNGKAVTKIGDGAFVDVSLTTSCLIKSIVIPDSFTTIGQGAFMGCTNLTSVAIGKGVTSIGWMAFINCQSLTSIIIPIGVTFIGAEAFNNCHNLTIICEAPSQPEGWDVNWNYDNRPVIWATDSNYFTFTLLDDDTYSIKAADITNMPADVILPSMYNGKPVTKIEDGAFIDIDTLIGCSTITSVIIPDSVTTIGGYAFVNCPNLTSVTIGNGVVIISASAFRYCLNLTSVVIGDSVTTIDEYAFYDCRKLTSVIMGNSVTTIGGNAFGYCSSLASITIPDSVTSIGSSAFQQCGFTTVFIPDSVITIGSAAFSSSNLTTIYCEIDAQPSGWNSNWNSREILVIWGYNPLGDDYLTFTEQADGTYSVKATDVSTLPSEVYIPFSYNGKAVTAIDENAFYSATINKVVIPEGVTRIGNGAFDNCKRLLDVSLPSTLTEIGGWAFRDCTALTSIVIPIGVTTIGTWAFLRDMSLTINCEAASQPSGWHTDWNISGGTVVWGYTG